MQLSTLPYLPPLRANKRPPTKSYPSLSPHPFKFPRMAGIFLNYICYNVGLCSMRFILLYFGPVLEAKLYAKFGKSLYGRADNFCP